MVINLVRYVLAEIKAPKHEKEISVVMTYDVYVLFNYLYLISCQNLSTEICMFCDV